MRMPSKRSKLAGSARQTIRCLSVVFYDLTTLRIHGEGRVKDDIRAYGMNKETGVAARQFVRGMVESAGGLPLMHTIHPGNVSKTKSLHGLLHKVLTRFPVQRVILVWPTADS